MDIAIIILTILGVIITIGAAIIFCTTCEIKVYTGFTFGCGIGILLSIIIVGIVYASSIPPIDVYRGKTTLKITYQDSIPIDSVVVYKNK